LYSLFQFNIIDLSGGMYVSIIVLAFFFITLLIVLPITFAYRQYQSFRKVALVALLIPIIAIGAATNFIYNLFYITSPDSMHIRFSEEGNQFIVNGQWNKKFERNSLGKDFIAISLEGDAYLIDTNMVEYKIEDQAETYLYEELRHILSANGSLFILGENRKCKNRRSTGYVQIEVV